MLVIGAAAVVFLGSAIALAVWLGGAGDKGASLPGIERAQPLAPRGRDEAPEAAPEKTKTTPAKRGRGRGRDGKD